MEQRIIQIGNSIGVVIPRILQKDSPFKIGDKVIVEKDPVSESFIVSKKTKAKNISITPEFLTWLNRFNKRYKDALAELAER